MAHRERVEPGVSTDGDRATLLRPQVIKGPHDPSGRYAHWVHRAERGGELLAPGGGNDHLQVIDVRDLARFVVTVIEHSWPAHSTLPGRDSHGRGSSR